MPEEMQAVEPDGCPKCDFAEYLGYEVPGVYDGVLYWVCPQCGHAFPRWVGDDDQRMVQLSKQYADEHNEPHCEKHGDLLIWEEGGTDKPTPHGRWYCPSCQEEFIEAVDQ